MRTAAEWKSSDSHFMCCDEIIEAIQADARAEGRREGWLAAAEALSHSGDMYLEKGESWLIDKLEGM